ncbi:hypothetical protein Tco_1255876 [Tanacetum coccineum]
MLTKPQFFYDHTTKQALGFQNPFYLKKAQQLEPKLYDGNVIKNTSAIVIPDSEETLMLAEESRSKMLLKQKDPMMLEKKVNTTPVDYANSMNSSDPTLSSRPTKVEVPKELPKVSMVNTSLKKLKHHLAGFDVVEKVLVITALKDDLKKLKGKDLVDDDVMKHIIDPETLKIDVEPITSKLYTKLIQELLTNISKICPSINNSGEKLVVVTPKNNDKRVRFTEPVTSSGNTNTKIASSSNLVSNKPMLPSTGVKSSTSASGSQPSSNTKKYKIQRTPSSTQKNKVEAHPKTVKSSLKNKNSAVEPKGTANVQHFKLNATSEPLCVKNLVNLRESLVSDVFIPSLLNEVVQIVLWYLDSGCSKHMTEDRSQLTNFVNKFLGTVKFKNDHVAKILGYGDYQIGNVMISRVYYVEGLGHNLFFVGYSLIDLEFGFRQTTLTSFSNLEGCYSIDWISEATNL